MRLIGVAMVKNEADIIEASVRHNLALLDHLTVLDHGSTDATRRILEALRGEGLPLAIIDGAGAAFNQAGATTELLRRALPAERGDFGFALDADEFLLARRGELEAELATADPGTTVSARWRTYVPPAVPEPPMHPLRSARLRCAEDHDVGVKVALSRAQSQRADWTLSPGNHGVLRIAGPRPEWIPTTILSSARIGHVPLRSAEQLASKVLTGWFGHRLVMRERARSTQLIWQWRALFDRLVRGERFGPADVQRAALEYYVLNAASTPEAKLPLPALTEDPIQVTQELRYTPAAPPDPLCNLALWVEQLLDSMLLPPTPPRSQA